MKGTEKFGRSVYLGMKESDVFMDRLAKPICSRQGIIPSDEVEYRVCSEISECAKFRFGGTLNRWQAHAFMIWITNGLKNTSL